MKRLLYRLRPLADIVLPHRKRLSIGLVALVALVDLILVLAVWTSSGFLPALGFALVLAMSAIALIAAGILGGLLLRQVLMPHYAPGWTNDRPAPTPPAATVGPVVATPSPPEAEPRSEAEIALLAAIATNPPPPPAERGPRTYPVPILNGPEPCVTIVVPLFNEQRFVADTIKSLQAQTVRNFTAIVVDDASTDESAAVALRAIGNDRRFTLVRHLRNGGLSASRNTGLRLALTPYVTFLDSDDMLLPDALEVRLKRFGELTDDRVAGVFCGVVSAPESVGPGWRPANLGTRRPPTTFISTDGECPFNAHAPIVRTDVLRRIGGFDESYRHGCEDWDLWVRVMRHGYWFESVGHVAAVYRNKKGSMVRAMTLQHIQAGREIFDRAHRPLPPAEIVPGTPFVFTKSVDDYRSEVAFTARAVGSAAMAFMQSPDQFASVLAMLPAEVWAYAKKQINIRANIEASLVRFVAVDPYKLRGEGRPLELARRAVEDHLDAAAAAEHLAEAHPVDIRVDVALFASNARQAAVMADLADDLRIAGRSCVLVSVELITGDQGAADLWAGRGLESLSYNSYAFREWRLDPAIRVVMRPYDAVIRELATGLGGRIVEIADPSLPVDMPDENLPALPEAVVDIESAASAVLVRLDGGQRPPPDFVTGPAETPRALGTPALASIGLEEKLDLVPDYEKLRAFKDRYRGERCFIIGNGPSLNTLDLTRLAGEYTFAVNGIFYKREDMGFDPTFYVVEDSSVMNENIDAIRDFTAEHKFYPTIYRNKQPATDNTQFFLMNRGFYETTGPAYCVPRFSVDAARRVFCGQSVTHINLQLAYYFGFSQVCLIGMDFSYVIPDSAIKKGDLITSTEDDPNHFHKSYFGAGKTWKDPKLHRVKLNYELARDVYVADGREIINATNGGALEVFRRIPYADLV